MAKHNRALSSWVTKQKFDLKNNSLLKTFCPILPKVKILQPQTIFTCKHPMVNFSQTTVTS